MAQVRSPVSLMYTLKNCVSDLRTNGSSGDSRHRHMSMTPAFSSHDMAASYSLLPSLRMAISP